MLASLLALASIIIPFSAAKYSSDLQVFPPVLAISRAGEAELTDSFVHAYVKQPEKPTCQGNLMNHTFGASYYKPFVGEYKPPECSFNRVTWNMTVSVAGRQFDRLGWVFLGDVEVWRPSTAEPTKDGIFYTYLKDMTPYLSLLKTEQKLTFELDNIVYGNYTGSFNVTLSSQFFMTDIVPSIPADRILGVTDKTSSGGPVPFTVPKKAAAVALKIPQNVKRAVFTLSATGQADEEFWWSNVPSTRTATFGSAGTLYGFSPFREVQLLIDGKHAGYSWPFPVIFAGGVIPGLWRPVVGIDALDLKEDEIDVTPFLPLLCDGQPHTFSIKVVGLEDDGHGKAVISREVGDYWLISGKLFLWLDEEGHVTTGSGTPYVLAPSNWPSVHSEVSTNSDGTVNETLGYFAFVSREFFASSMLNLANGKTFHADWKQFLNFEATGNLTNGGNNQVNKQLTTGFKQSSSGYAQDFSYPFYALSTVDLSNNAAEIHAVINRSKMERVLGSAVLPSGIEGFKAVGKVEERAGSNLVTSQNSTATYIAPAGGSNMTFGTTSQEMKLESLIASESSTAGVAVFPDATIGGILFERRVDAVNGTIVDDEALAGASVYSGAVALDPKKIPEDLVLGGIPGRGGRWKGMLTNPNGYESLII